MVVLVASCYRVLHVLVLDGWLQFDDSHPMPRLSQTDLHDEFLAVMMPVRCPWESSLRDHASSHHHFLVHRFKRQTSSVPSLAVNLASEATLCRYRLIVCRWYVIRIWIDYEGGRIANILAVISLR